MTVVFPGGRDIFLGKVGKQGQNKGMSGVVDAKGRFSGFFSLTPIQSSGHERDRRVGW